jgi:hypothetical protein
MVSVVTGHVEYHPVYLSIGNPHNNVWRAHRNVVIPIAFLAIPKCVWYPSCATHVRSSLLLIQVTANTTTARVFDTSNATCFTHRSKPFSPRFAQA